jgi:uncharacterized RDD family membrane protein YckC
MINIDPKELFKAIESKMGNYLNNYSKVFSPDSSSFDSMYTDFTKVRTFRLIWDGKENFLVLQQHLNDVNKDLIVVRLDEMHDFDEIVERFEEILISECEGSVLKSNFSKFENDNANVHRPKPWSRFWARNFDVLFHGIIFSVIWVIMDDQSLVNINSNLLGILILFGWVFIEGIYMATWGTTLGKSLFKISVRNSIGTKLSTKQAFKRSRLVWLRGMGIGIGIVSLVAHILGYNKLVKDGITTWDKEMDLIVFHDKISIIRGILIFVILLSIYSLLIYGIVSGV